jgi:hypothetical protein
MLAHLLHRSLLQEPVRKIRKIREIPFRIDLRGFCDYCGHFFRLSPAGLSSLVPVLERVREIRKIREIPSGP